MLTRVPCPDPFEELAPVNGPELVVPDVDVRPRIRVLVVDPQPLVAECICSALEATQILEVIDVATTARQAEHRAVGSGVDVVVIADGLPDEANVAALASRIQARCTTTQVVVLVESPSQKLSMAVLDARCCGYLTKRSSVDSLVEAIRHAHAGETVIDPAVLTGIVTRLRPDPSAKRPSLTAREQEVLSFLAQGRTNAEIAAILFISRATVRNHVHHVLAKLEARSRLEAVSIAVREGIVDYE